MSIKKKKRIAEKKRQSKNTKSPKKIKQSPLNQRKLSHLQINLLAIIIIIIVGYLAYSNGLNGEMIYDDIKIIHSNAKLHDFNDFMDLKKWINPNHRHFAMLTYAINYSIHENNVFGFHLFNLFVHIIFGIFAFLLAKLILSISIFDNNPQRKHTALMALFIGLICLLHPIQTQAVSYIVQRMASMAGMFYLISLYFYVKGRLLFVKDGLNNKVILLYLFALLGGLLGLLTKQTVVTLPFAILLFELFFIRNKEGALFKKYLVISFSLLFLLFLVIILGGYLPKETEIISRSEYLFTQFRVIITYIQLLFIPANQALDYDFAISTSLSEWKVIVSSLIILALITAAILLYKKKHLISFGIFWFFLTLSVESSIIPIQDVIFEHRLYIPIFGFSLIIVSLIWDLFAKKWLFAVIVFFVVLNIIYAAKTYERNKVWKFQISLWSDNIDKYPNAIPPYVNRGNVYFNAGKYREAVADYTTGIELDSNNYQLYFNRGVSLKQMKQYKLALFDFSMAIKNRNPRNYQSYMERGIIYTDNLKQYNLGIKDFKTFLSHNPDHVDATVNLAIAYFNGNSYDSALVYCNKSIELAPKKGLPYYFAAVIYADRKDFGQAYAYGLQARSHGYPIEETLFSDWSKRANEEAETGDKK